MGRTFADPNLKPSILLKGISSPKYPFYIFFLQTYRYPLELDREGKSCGLLKPHLVLPVLQTCSRSPTLGHSSSTGQTQSSVLSPDQEGATSPAENLRLGAFVCSPLAPS
jgi:hypothetical protein